MINSNDCVTLSDDDNFIQATESKLNRKRKNRTHSNHKKIKSIETIVIDGETSNHIENNNIIELPDSQELLDIKIQKLDQIRQEVPIFSDFVEKCLDLENSDGMIRIVNKTVINAYEECDYEYRKSSKFQKILLKAINRLETDPDHKFSHVKDLVDTLKLHKLKKRVQLTTLATNLKENGTHLNNGFSKNTKISIIIDSDDDDQIDVPIPTINLDDYQNEVIEVLDEEKENHQQEKENHQEQKENYREEKENHQDESRSLPNSQESFLIPQVEVSWNPNTNIPFCTVQQVLPIEYEPPPVNAEKDERIKAIVSQIMWCREQVTLLDEAEVVDDSAASPYILCEKYKAQIVQLYKQLCQLTGEEPVKRRKVRLQVLEGHPPGPVKRLESFINDNIGEDGIPLFPDFFDVVKCVMVANFEDKMRWNKQQVMTEANSLFTQCGRALQKRRQRREYRDLLSRVKVERPEQEAVDPAEQDPELQRKLEENRKIALTKEKDLLDKREYRDHLSGVKVERPEQKAADPAEQNPELQRKLEENRKIAITKENDLLDKYVRLQNQPTQKKAGPSLQNVPNEQTPHINGHINHGKVPNEQTQHTNGYVNQGKASDHIFTANKEPIPSSTLQSLSNYVQNKNNTAEDSSLSNILQMKNNTAEDSSLSNILQMKNNTAEDSSLSNNLQNNLIENQESTPCQDLISDEDSDFEPPEVRLSQETAEAESETENKDQKVKIKQEPLDIAQMLADLGDNYTMTVTDIEDPFLVIEISSDESSDDEMHVEGESD